MQKLHPQTLEFLQGIDDFNEKKFFELYKPLYLNIKDEFEKFTQELIDEIAKFDKSFEKQEAKPCIFRIYKDMRRPKNRERPYKINMGASITVWWRKSPLAWYYLHIQNGQSFFCGGLRRPKSATAYPIREHMYQEWETFKKIINKRTLKQVFGSVSTSQDLLKKANRNSQYSKILWTIPDEHPSLQYLAMKDWLRYKPLTNEEVLNEDFLEQCVEYAKISSPSVQFINEAIV